MINSILDFLNARQDIIEYRIGGGVEDVHIENAESSIGTAFPESYKRFLREVGWLEINNIYFFGVRKDSVDEGEGNVVVMAKYSRDTWELPNHLIPVYSADDQVLWCIDSSITGKEPPIVSYETKKKKVTTKVAPDYWTCLSDYLESEK